MKKLLLILIMPLLFSCSDSTFDVHTFYQEMEDVGLFLPPDSLIVHAYIMGSDGEHKTPSYQETLGMEVNLYWDVIYKVDQLLYNEIKKAYTPSKDNNINTWSNGLTCKKNDDDWYYTHSGRVNEYGFCRCNRKLYKKQKSYNEYLKDSTTYKEMLLNLCCSNLECGTHSGSNGGSGKNYEVLFYKNELGFFVKYHLNKWY